MSYGSKYVNTSSAKSFKKSRFPKIASLFALVALMVTVAVPLALSATGFDFNSSARGETSVTTASAAGGFLCADPKKGQLGSSMNTPESWDRFGSRPHPDAKSRSFSAMEVLSNGVHFVTFGGAGKGNDKVFGIDIARDGLTQKQVAKALDDAGTTDNQAEAVFSKFESIRNGNNCFTAVMTNGIARGVLGFSNGIANLTSGIVTWAFDPNIICKDPDNPGFGCVNIVGIVGGTSSSPGLISKLTSSIYAPLLVLVFLWVGLTIIYKMTKGGRVREALSGALWAVLVMAIGFMLLYNPTLVAKAPMAASNTIANCVLGGFSGSNCMTGSSASSGTNNTPLGGDAICNAGGNVAFDEQISFTVGNLNCNIWRAFILEPYAQSSFGAPLDDLYMTNTKTKELVTKAGFEPESFCINLSTTGSAREYEGKQLNLNGSDNKVCNLAIYQLFVGTNAKTTSNGVSSAPPADSTKIDPRWLKIATVAASDNGMWSKWHSAGFEKFHYAGLSLMTTAAGSFINATVSLFALAYYFLASIMLILLPFFLLLGIPDGRGRKLLLGYTGSLLSNIMKYAASAIMLVVSISVFGAVLKTITNGFTMFILVAILTVALWMYRSEIVGLLGRVDLAGETLSNKFGEKISKTKDTTLRTAGAAAGAMMATGTMNPGENLKAAASGASDGFKRSIKGKGGFAGNVVSQLDRASSDNHRDLRAESQKADRNSQSELAAAQEAATRAEASASQIVGLDNKAAKAEVVIETQASFVQTIRNAEQAALHKIEAKDPDLAELLALTSRLEDLKIDIGIAEVKGDATEVARLKSMEVDYSSRHAHLTNVVDPRRIDVGEKFIASTVEKEAIAAGDKSFGNGQDAATAMANQKKRYNNARAVVETYDDKRTQLETINAQAEAESLEHRRNAASESARGKSLHEEFVKIKPGQRVSDSTIDAMHMNADAVGSIAANGVDAAPAAKTAFGDRTVDRPGARTMNDFNFTATSYEIPDLIPNSNNYSPTGEFQDPLNGSTTQGSGGGTP